MHAPPEEPPALAEVDLRGLSPARERASSRARPPPARRADLARGPRSRPPLRRGPPGPGLLLLVIHHLVVDGVSWRILADDLEEGYRRLAAGEAPAFPPKTTAFRDWAVRLAEHARSAELARELPLWLALADAEAEAALPLDRQGARTMSPRRRPSRARFRPRRRVPSSRPRPATGPGSRSSSSPPSSRRSPLDRARGARARPRGARARGALPRRRPPRAQSAGLRPSSLLLRCPPARAAGERVRAVKESCAPSRRAGSASGSFATRAPTRKCAPASPRSPSPGWPSTTWASSGRRAPDRRRPSPTSAARPAARAPAAATCSR